MSRITNSEIMVLAALQKLNMCVEQMNGFRGAEDNTHCIEPFACESATSRRRKQTRRVTISVLHPTAWLWDSILNVMRALKHG